MNKVKIDYVFSGTSALDIELPLKIEMSEEFKSIRREIITKGIDKILQIINERSKIVEVEFSLLYNAFIEPKWGLQCKQNNNYSFSNLYADSGGLQVITQGKVIDDSVKKWFTVIKILVMYHFVLMKSLLKK